VVGYRFAGDTALNNTLNINLAFW